MPKITLIVVILIVAAVALIYYAHKKYTSLLSEIEVRFSTLDIYLRKRWDMVPKFVEIAKGYMQNDKETIQNIVEIRERNYDNLNRDAKLDLNYSISSELYTLVANADNYQELKISVGFQNLKNQFYDNEVEISKLRKQYNSSVTQFNNLIKQFPYDTIAKQCKVQEQKILEVDEAKRNSIGLSL